VALPSTRIGASVGAAGRRVEGPQCGQSANSPSWLDHFSGALQPHSDRVTTPDDNERVVAVESVVVIKKGPEATGAFSNRSVRSASG
jgi:hypothetical protein